jgi:pilus assembly protein CpaF
MSGLLDRVGPPKSQLPVLSVVPDTPSGRSALSVLTVSVPLREKSNQAQQEKSALRRQLRHWIAEKILASLTTTDELKPDNSTLSMLRGRFREICASANINLPSDDIQHLENEVLDELVGLGTLEPLLKDPAITEIMVNGAKHVFVERKGRVSETDIQFDDDAQVMRIIERILCPLGRHVDRKWPIADARLPDGSRVNVIIPPSAIDGPTITIRKFSQDKLTIDDLVRFGSLTDSMGEFLRACVTARLNIIVAGGTGSGKTTLLNVLSNFIPDHERVVTIEDSAELQLAKPHVVRLEARPPDPDGTGRVTIRDLVINALRMRPERIVVGEVRDAAALDMLQAMNTGHDGSLTTLHANTPRDVLSRLETMVLMAGIEFPIKAIREQIAAAIDLIVQQERLRDGSRKIVQIAEVQGMEGDIIVMQDIFRFIESTLESTGKVTGEFASSGIRPKFSPRLELAGVKLPPEIYGASASGGVRQR